MTTSEFSLEGIPDSSYLPQPTSVESTGIDPGLLLDLCIKTVYYAGRPSARLVAERLALPFSVAESLLSVLRRQEFLDIVGSGGMSEQEYQYTVTNKGLQKTQEALEKNQYVGPAPVPFDVYVETLKAQTVLDIETPAEMSSSFPNLVLSDELLDHLGTAMASGKSLFLYGEPGNGKSAIAEAFGAALNGHILVPHAIEAYGQIIKVFDPRIHTRVPESPSPSDQEDASLMTRDDVKRDLRWAICQRPVVVTGGELTLEDLDLRFSPVTKYYSSPVQLKSNNGVLVIDDFGRQMVRPDELLNRWMIPLDRRVDHLTFHTGETIEVPFDVMLIFATNLPPSALGDEAFFRRIRHKIKVQDPDEATFREILRREAERSRIGYSESSADYLIKRHYRTAGRPFRGVHGRDIFNLILDMSKYRRCPPGFDSEWIDRACESYFVED